MTESLCEGERNRMGGNCCKLQRCRNVEGRSSLSSRYRVGVRPGKLSEENHGVEASWQIVKPMEDGGEEQRTKRQEVLSPSPIQGGELTVEGQEYIRGEGQGQVTAVKRGFPEGMYDQQSPHSQREGLRYRRRRLARPEEEQEAFENPGDEVGWTKDQRVKEERFWIPDSLASHMGLEKHRRVRLERRKTDEDADEDLLHEVMQMYNSPREDVSQLDEVRSSKKDTWLAEEDQFKEDASPNLMCLDPAIQRSSVTIFVEDASQSNCVN